MGAKKQKKQLELCPKDKKNASIDANYRKPTQKKCPGKQEFKDTSESIK